MEILSYNYENFGVPITKKECKKILGYEKSCIIVRINGSVFKVISGDTSYNIVQDLIEQTVDTYDLLEDQGVTVTKSVPKKGKYFVLYYWHHCKHCHEFLHDYAVANVGNFDKLMIEREHIEEQPVEIFEFPTVVFFENGNYVTHMSKDVFRKKYL